MSSANGSEMKRTGIIRRIDDLGRIVIPREIRNILRIRENDPLDGYDPYSNSKSCSELVTHSYKKSFFGDGRLSLIHI